MWANCRKNASDKCAFLSEAYGRETMKLSCVSVRHTRFKEYREKVEVDEHNAHHFLRY
jgi:hypothetical protein